MRSRHATNGRVYHCAIFLLGMMTLLVDQSSGNLTSVVYAVPSAIGVGGCAQVYGSNAYGGLRVRNGPGLGYSQIGTVYDGTIVHIIGGPTNADGYTWWQHEYPASSPSASGWSAGAYLTDASCPAAAGNLVLIQDLSVSSTSPSVNQNITGSFRVKNTGGQAITIEYLGIQGRLNGDLNGTARDFNWDQNITLQPGQEYGYSSSRSFELTGNWTLRPNFRMNGVWSDVHRSDGSVDTLWITVQNAPPPGNLVLIQDLSVSTTTPAVNQSVSGSFRVKNTGGQAITLDYLGIQGRLNGDVNGTAEDFNWVQNLTLQPNDEYAYSASRSFDMAGNWTLRPNYKPSGGDWNDVHRADGSVNTVWITVQSIVPAGNLVLIQDMSVSSLSPNLNENISASYRVKNTGGQAITLEYLGVQGRLSGDVNGTARDFNWIQNLVMQPGDEYAYSASRSFDFAGNWTLRPNYKPSGGNWDDIHRSDGSVNTVWISVQSSTPVDGATVLGQSNNPTVPAGQYFQIWFDVTNSGTSTWSTSNNFYLENGNGQTLGAPSKLDIGGPIGPQSIFRWNLVMQAPSTPGAYSTQWQMKHLGNACGPNMSVNVNVISSGSPSSGIDLRVVSGPTIVPSAPSVNQQVQASFVVRNFGNSTASVNVLALGGRGPAGDSDIEDFPWAQGISVAPGQEYSFGSSRQFSQDGQYRFFPVYQTWDGSWIELRGSAGESKTQYVSFVGPNNVALRRLETNYTLWSREVLDIKYTNLRPQADGSLIANIIIVNKKKVALAVRFVTTNGPLVVDEQGILARPYIAILPTTNTLTGNVDPSFQYGGYVIRNVVFKSDSKLHVSYTAWGGGGEDTRVLTLLNATTIACVGIILEWCPSNLLDGSVDVFDGIIGIVEQTNSNAFWFDVGQKAARLDLFGMVQLAGEWIKDNAAVVAQIAAKLGIQGLSTEAIKDFFGLPFHIILTYPKLIFEWAPDVGGAKWWGTSDLDIVPSTRRATNSQVINLGRPNPTSATTDGVPGNSVVASSSEFGPGWEYYHLLDGRGDTGWSNGGNLAIDQWVTIRLADGQPVSVTQINIHPGPTGGDLAENALKQFRLESSLDGMNYSLLIEGEFSLSEIGIEKTFLVPIRLARFLKFHAVSNQSGGTDPYVSVAELKVFGDIGSAGDAFEPDDDFRLARYLPTNGFKTKHVFSYPGDIDWIQFWADTNTTYEVMTSDLASNSDTVLELYAEDGKRLLARNDDYAGTLASRIRWTSPISGYLYTAIHHYYPTASGPDTAYSVAVTTVPTGGSRIQGNVTFGGNTDANIPLELRYYDGNEFISAGFTTSEANGRFQFVSVGVSALTNTAQRSTSKGMSAAQSSASRFEQKTLRRRQTTMNAQTPFYYVRFINNMNDPRYLWFWGTDGVLSPNSGDIISLGTFDIKNVPLGGPASSVDLPATFNWTIRNISSDYT